MRLPRMLTRRSMVAVAISAFAASAGIACRHRNTDGGPATPEMLFPFCERGKWGYIDPVGTVIIPPRFTRADDFHDGRALVQSGGSTRYIDDRGRTACTILGDWARPYRDGLAPFRDPATGKFGYRDRNGRVVIEPKYDAARDFSEGLAVVNLGAGWVKEFPRPVVPRGGKWGFIDKAGRLVVPRAVRERCIPRVLRWARASHRRSWVRLHRQGREDCFPTRVQVRRSEALDRQCGTVLRRIGTGPDLWLRRPLHRFR